MHERIGQRLSYRFAWIIRHILTKRTVDHRSNSHIPCDRRKRILNHGRNWSDDSLRIEEPPATFDNFTFPNARKRRECNVQTREKLLGERAQGHQSAQCWM